MLDLHLTLVTGSFVHGWRCLDSGVELIVLRGGPSSSISTTPIRKIPSNHTLSHNSPPRQSGCEVASQRGCLGDGGKEGSVMGARRPTPARSPGIQQILQGRGETFPDPLCRDTHERITAPPAMTSRVYSPSLFYFIFLEHTRICQASDRKSHFGYHSRKGRHAPGLHRGFAQGIPDQLSDRFRLLERGSGEKERSACRLHAMSIH